MCINASTVEGERARDDASQLFLRGCARKRRSPGEMSSLEKSMGNSITNGGAGGLPRRRSDPRTATRTALHYGAPGAFQVCHLAHGLEGLDIEFFLH